MRHEKGGEFMEKIKELSICADLVTANKKYKLGNCPVYIQSEISPDKVRLAGRIWGRFLKDPVAVKKICSILDITEEELLEKNKDDSCIFNVGLLRDGFKELTSFSSYWDNLQKKLDYVATYDEGKEMKDYEFDDYSERFVSSIKEQIDFQFYEALNFSFHMKRIDSEVYQKRMKNLQNVEVEEEEVSCCENIEVSETRNEVFLKFLKNRVMCQKICKVLGFTRKDLFKKDEDDRNIFDFYLVSNGFEQLTGSSSYWEHLQQKLDYVAAYDDMKGKYDSEYREVSEEVITNLRNEINTLFRDSLNQALLKNHIRPREYSLRMANLRRVLIDEAVQLELKSNQLLEKNESFVPCKMEKTKTKK